MCHQGSCQAVLRLVILVIAMCLTQPALATGATAGMAATQTRAHPMATASFRDYLKRDESVEIAVALRLRNTAGLDATLQALHQPGHPAYHHWLGRTDIERDYEPTSADAQTVVDYLLRAGFSDVHAAPNHLLVSAKGGPDAVRKAFHTELGHFVREGRSGIANLQDVQVPAVLGGRVLAVLGLQTLDRMRPMSVQAAAVNLTGSVHGINPVNFPQAYGAASLPAATATSVAIITAGSMTQTLADLQSFQAQNQLPAIVPRVVTVGSAGTDTSGTPEWDLDSQTIQSMAGGQVKELRLYAAHSFLDSDITSAINRAVSDNVAAVINMSLGVCETAARSDGSLAADDQLFKLAVAQGQTFAVSTGDSGASECGAPVGTLAGAAYPASSPYVVAVGGTTLYMDAAGNYGGEVAWTGGGGSPSLIEPRPAWQTGVVAGNFRGLPDVAFDADPNSGAVIVVNGAAAQYGGTSLAAPLFVASWARIQTANNARLGLPSTWIYSRGVSGTTAFHDVVTGSNGTYSAAPGWDFTTGFGSFDVSATAALTRSAVIITASSATIRPGQSLTLSATVTGNSPSGTVQFQVNGVNLGAPVALVNGVATLTTTQLTLTGADVISAVYSGDLNNAGGPAAAGLTEVVATAGNSDGGDVPLPPWALMLLGSGLVIAFSPRNSPTGLRPGGNASVRSCSPGNRPRTRRP